MLVYYSAGYWFDGGRRSVVGVPLLVAGLPRRRPSIRPPSYPTSSSCVRSSNWYVVV